MSGLDDARLRAHLERRSAIGEPTSSLAQAIEERVAAAPRRRQGPAANLGPHRGWLALAALLSGLAVVVASAGIKLPLAPPDGGSPALTILSPSQLVQLVTGSPAESWVDRLVIVDADVEYQRFSCVAPGPCAIGYVGGTDRRVVVRSGRDPTFRASGHPRRESPDGGVIQGPIALRLSQDGVDLIGVVATNGGGELVWTLESVASEVNRLADQGPPTGPDGVALGPLFVVDAWLAQTPFAPPCLGPLPGTSTSVIPYMCGTAAWLTPWAIKGDELDTPASMPADGLRVQNGAYDSFAPDPARSGSLELPEPRRALYLVRSILQFPAGWCALCDGRPAYIVGRVDAISAPEATPSPVPPSLTLLTTAEFSRLLAGTPQEERGDRIVIVDGDIKVSTFSCPAFTAPSCPIGTLVGAEPSLLVWSDSAPAYVDDARGEWDWLRDTIKGPLALRLAASGQVELVGPVETLGPSTVWPLWATVSEIERLRSFDRRIGSDGIAVGPLFVVDAWLVTPMAAECPAPAGSPAPSLAAFACGRVGFLTPEAIQPTTLRGDTILTTVPEGSIRVQNLAYDTFAPDPTWSTVGRLAEPRRALYLVRSIVDFPQDSCFMCEAGAQAFVVARLDPIEVPPAGEN